MELQAELMDAMGLAPEAVVVLHVGGAAGGHPAALERFERGFELLSDRARDRLPGRKEARPVAARGGGGKPRTRGSGGGGGGPPPGPGASGGGGTPPPPPATPGGPPPPGRRS